MLFMVVVELQQKLSCFFSMIAPAGVVRKAGPKRTSIGIRVLYTGSCVLDIIQPSIDTSYVKAYYFISDPRYHLYTNS